MYKVKGALKKVGSEDPGQGLKRKGEKDSNNNNQIRSKLTKIWFFMSKISLMSEYFNHSGEKKIDQKSNLYLLKFIDIQLQFLKPFVF